jgi:hypothetical protein
MRKQKVTLPKDLTEFLTHDLPLKYNARKCECGQVTLVPLGKHLIGEVWVDPDNSKFPTQSPHAGKTGYYAIPAINLIATCEAYDPEFILLWLPESEMYGCWDCDHWELLVFPKATWSNIAGDPLQYINAQWHPQTQVSEILVPWPKYPFKKGRPF